MIIYFYIGVVCLSSECFCNFYESDRPSLTLVKALNNMTKENGEEILMKCEFRGHPQPTISWYRNEAPIEPIKNKLEIRTNNSTGTAGKVVSRLRLLRADTHDMGFYKCEGSNTFETRETIGILRIEGGECCFLSSYI